MTTQNKPASSALEFLTPIVAEVDAGWKKLKQQGDELFSRHDADWDFFIRSKPSEVVSKAVAEARRYWGELEIEETLAVLRT